MQVLNNVEKTETNQQIKMKIKTVMVNPFCSKHKQEYK